MRLWGLYLIPRDKAPDEGFHLTFGRKYWSAWRLPGTQVPRGRPVDKNAELDQLCLFLVAGEDE